MGKFSRRLLIASLALAPLAVAAADAGRDVFVAGGTGALGAEIVRRLLDQGEKVTVFSRPGSDRSRLAGLDVTFVEGDLLDADTVAAAFRGRSFRAVITAVRVETGDSSFYRKIMPPLVAGAKLAGAAQFIHSGAVGAGANAEQFTGLGWERVPGLLDRLRDQGVGEDILRESGLRYTIIRNTRLYPDGTPATGKAKLTEDQTVIDAMTRADLARLTVDCLGNHQCFDKTFHVRDGSLAWPPPGAR